MSQSLFATLLHNGSQYLVGVATGAISLAKMLPHTFGLPKYQSFLQLYDNGFEVKLDAHTQELAQEVLDAMQLKEELEARTTLFVAYGQEMVSKGSLYARNGGIVGIPANFKYQNINDVERNKVILNTKAVEWDSNGGEMLAEAMVLSDSAKQFAIARELFAVKSYWYAVDAFLASTAFLGSYALGFFLNRSMGLRARLPMAMRGVVYTGVASLGYLTYIVMGDAYNCRRDRKLDEKAGKLMPVLGQGGVEYYTKLLQRNTALRELMGSSGPKLYTAYGNVTQSWRTPRLSLSTHRDFMVSMVKENHNIDKVDELESGVKSEAV